MTEQLNALIKATMTQKKKADGTPIEAFLGMDEVDTTERILFNMTDPDVQEEKQWKKQDIARADGIRSRHSL